jgi:hypothetical protein
MMAWSDGYIRLDCGHDIGTERWDSTLVGDDVRCPQCKATRQVERMSRIYEARPSADFSLGVTHVPEGSAGAAEDGPPAS